MNAAYWAQWGRAELMSMQGIEIDTYYNNNEHEDDLDRNEAVLEEEEQQHCSSCGRYHYCSNFCMECLGFSWKDFM